MDSVPGHDYAGDESHYLLAARSLANQRNIDVRDDYRVRGWRDFDTAPPKPQGVLHDGARYEPHSIGLPLLAAPFYALGGARAVELLVAALLAAAMALSYLLARRVVPDPWCLYAALAVGLSPPLVAHGTAVFPEPVAAAALAGAALCAARLRDGPSRPAAAGCFILLGTLPWLGLVFIPPAVVIGWSAVRSLRRAGRGLLALGSSEVAFFSLALLVGLNEALFGGPTPHAADRPGTSATGVDSVGGYLDRSWRVVALFLDRDYGLVRWAPIVALAFVGVWVLYRSSRERLGRAIAGLDEELGVARLCGAAALATVLTAALLVPSLDAGGFPGRALIAVVPLLVPLVALGLRQLPRIGALLALLGIAGSAWLWVDARSGGGLFQSRPDAPWGPLVDLFPRFHGDIWPYLLLAAVAAALAAPVVRQELEVRRRLG
jgi:4-amino-4-deoxy-L-arabinose transferase-like glycosyltransferase